MLNGVLTFIWHLNKYFGKFIQYFFVIAFIFIRLSYILSSKRNSLKNHIFYRETVEGVEVFICFDELKYFGGFYAFPSRQRIGGYNDVHVHILLVLLKRNKKLIVRVKKN